MPSSAPSVRLDKGHGSPEWATLGTVHDDPVAVLQRWEDCGGVWRVLERRSDAVTVGLYRCDGGEEMDRVSSADPRLLKFLADRHYSGP
ncbi:hypothetical protein BH10ACT9_BH10ACT9_21820 [soil metagenome]